jgi:hypothetical protein
VPGTKIVTVRTGSLREMRAPNREITLSTIRGD